MSNSFSNIPIITGLENAALVGGAELRNLMYFGKLQNVKIVNGKANPYTNKLNLNYTRDAAVNTSDLGTPVYCDLKINGLSYTDNITGNVVNAGTTGNLYMEFETIILTVNQAVKVIKTSIQGSNGTVKEYIGLDDATITINGILTGQNGVHPFDDTALLKAWLDAPLSKPVVCRWLNNMGINNVVVESYNFPQVQGGYSYQPFTINCISDAPVTLRISQPVIGTSS